MNFLSSLMKIVSFYPERLRRYGAPTNVGLWLFTRSLCTHIFYPAVRYLTFAGLAGIGLDTVWFGVRLGTS